MASPPSVPIWDRGNIEERQLVHDSIYSDLINQNRVNLQDNLQLDGIWAYLKELCVLNRNDEERIKNNRPRPDVVLVLLDFIEMGPRWRYHGLMRALALTDQSHLIPHGGPDPKVYGGSRPAQDNQPPHLPRQLIRVIREHCRSNVDTLMQSAVFDFEDDPDYHTIDISQCLIPVQPEMSGGQRSMIPIPTKEILEKFCDKVSPRVIRLYGDPGDGKSSLLRHIAYCWCKEFLELTENELSLKSRFPTWTTMVYLSACDITGTIEEAIRDALGCKEADTNMMMDHINNGDGIALLVDSLDELRDAKAMEKLKRYVHQRKLKGGPTVLLAARTNLCPIDRGDIDRFIEVRGFTDHQGLEYVRLYTEMCKVQQQPDQPPLLQYVTQYQQELKSVLTNPLRLFIFCALAVRGELDLSNETTFNIPKLFGPLEGYLLRREGSKVTEQQRQDFYRLCMYGLLNGLREFPESLLVKFNISKAYYVFLRRSSRRESDGASATYYSFSHEMVYEYFASCFISSLPTEQQKSILLFICSDEKLQNLQYIVFQHLLQEWDVQKDLIVTMLRFILILQFTAVGEKVEGEFIDLMSIRYRTLKDLFLEEILSCKPQEIDLRNSTRICEEITDAFEKDADRLRNAGWFAYIRANNTMKLVNKCLLACSVPEQEMLFEHTISKMLPCRSPKCYYFQISSTRWVYMTGLDHDCLEMHLWYPTDALHVLKQMVEKHPEQDISLIFMFFMSDSPLGYAPEDPWAEEEWQRVFKKFRPKELVISVRPMLPLTGMLSCLPEYASRVKNHLTLQVSGGKVPLGDLLMLLLRIKEIPLLSVTVSGPHVVLPSGVDEATLRLQRDMVCQISQLGLPPMPYCISKVLRSPHWVTESGERYLWPDGKYNFSSSGISLDMAGNEEAIDSSTIARFIGLCSPVQAQFLSSNCQ